MIYGPREDSFLLQKIVKQEVKSTDKVLDMGTGSGIQAITASEISKDTTAVDINPECINQLNNSRIKVIQSNLFENVEGKFDLIIFNPPSLPKDPNEPEDSALATTGGEKGSEIIEEFLKQAKEHLTKDGRILLLYSSLSGNTEEIAKKNYSFKILAEESFDFEKIYVAKLKWPNL